MHPPLLATSARLVMAVLVFCALPAKAAGDAIRFDIPVVPDVQRYADLLGHPGYAAVALENIGLNPSLSSKVIVTDRGKGLEIRNAILRYTGRNGSVYSYEAGVVLNLGVAESKLTFPLTIDTAGVPSGKISVTMSPPLAGIIPQELLDRVRIKAQLVANADAQRKVLGYLDGLAKTAPKDGASTALFEPILIEAYNKSSGPGTPPGLRDAGDAVPLSDQWLLLVTLAAWLIGTPAILLAYRLRRRHPKAA